MNGRFVKFLTAAALGAATVFGNTVSITNLDGNHNGSGDPQPYFATVGGISNVEIVCDDDYDNYTSGQNYSVQSLNNFNYVKTLYGNAAGIGSQTTATSLYDQIAYLVLQFTRPLSATQTEAVQSAIWDVYGNMIGTAFGSLPKTFGLSTDVNDSNATAYWLNNSIAGATLTANRNIGAAAGAYIEILTPMCGSTPCTVKGSATSQEFFLVAAPEPATYAMLGMGLILLSLATFRRRRKAN